MNTSRPVTATVNGLSIIIPAYNEADSIPDLISELGHALSPESLPWEIIFVDDGSTDGTLASMRAAAERDPRITVLHFMKKQGKSAAYTHGARIAQYPLLATLDADLQDDPRELPDMIRRVEEGWDLMVGFKQGRLGNEVRKAIPSWLFNRMTSAVFGIHLHDHNSGFRVMKREVLAGIDLYAGRYRFIPAFAHLRGFLVTEQPVRHRKRKFGKTKFGPSRFITGLLDMVSIRIISLFENRPFHLFGSVGLILFLTGAGLAALTLYRKIWLGDPFRNHFAAIISAATCVILAIHFASLGIIGELLLASRRKTARLRHEEIMRTNKTE